MLERLHTSGLITIEPLRAVISRGVVALLAVELFEVLALQLIDGLQQLIRSRRWPMRIRALRSHQTVISNDERELVELVRIWGPLLLVRVAPRLAPELQGVLGHALQQSLQNVMVPPGLRQLQPLLQVEKGLSRQLAVGMVDSLLDLTRSTGERLSRRDDQQLELLQRFIDRFWEELAEALESGAGPGTLPAAALRLPRGVQGDLPEPDQPRRHRGADRGTRPAHGEGIPGAGRAGRSLT